MFYSLLKDRGLTVCGLTQPPQGGRGTHKMETSSNLGILLPQEGRKQNPFVCASQGCHGQMVKNGHVTSPISTMV